LSLALGEAGRESMSEAGPLAAKLGYQWRPGSRALSASEGSGRWDLSAEGALDSWNVCGHDGRHRRSGSGTLELNSGCRGRDEGATGAPVSQPTGRVLGRQSPHELPLGTPSSPARGRGVGSSWRRSVNCVATQGRRCRQRLFGVAVDGNAWKLGRRPEGKRGSGCGGRKGESLKLESGVFRRVLVTTSQLQRSGRSIFSWKNDGASASWG
jgi:hypothetical protein